VSALTARNKFNLFQGETNRQRRALPEGRTDDRTDCDNMSVSYPDIRTQLVLTAGFHLESSAGVASAAMDVT